MFGEIKNAEGERIDYTFHPGKANSKDLVVIGHGVTGNKDRPFVVALAESLSRVGDRTAGFWLWAYHGVRPLRTSFVAQLRRP